MVETTRRFNLWVDYCRFDLYSPTGEDPPRVVSGLLEVVSDGLVRSRRRVVGRRRRRLGRVVERRSVVHAQEAAGQVVAVQVENFNTNFETSFSSLHRFLGLKPGGFKLWVNCIQLVQPHRGPGPCTAWTRRR
jgi:hypothetical protein